MKTVKQLKQEQANQEKQAAIDKADAEKEFEEWNKERIKEDLKKIPGWLDTKVTPEIAKAIKDGKNKTTVFDDVWKYTDKKLKTRVISTLKAAGYKASYREETCEGYYDNECGQIGSSTLHYLDISW